MNKLDESLFDASSGKVPLSYVGELLKKGANVNCNKKMDDGTTICPLFCAGICDDLEMVEFLVENGADINCMSKKNP